MVVVNWLTADVDLTDEVASEKVSEKFTEEDFDEELGSPTEVIGAYLQHSFKC